MKNRLRIICRHRLRRYRYQTKDKLRAIFIAPLRSIRYRWTKYEYGPDVSNVGSFHQIEGRKFVVTKKETTYWFYIEGHRRNLRPARWFDTWRATIRNWFFSTFTPPKQKEYRRDAIH